MIQEDAQLIYRAHDACDAAFSFERANKARVCFKLDSHIRAGFGWRASRPCAYDDYQRLRARGCEDTCRAYACITSIYLRVRWPLPAIFSPRPRQQIIGADSFLTSSLL